LLQLANLHDTPTAQSIMTTSVQRRASELSIPGDWATRAEAIVSADRLTAIGMGVWQSDGFHPNGDPFDRPGRTTVGLGRKKVGDPFVATHTHMSLFRGTPDRSFGKFG
ncbi:MAG: hypothetical protein Q8K85_04210, partial [Hyphomicrobium sp.]|nr:hypothetical protein [Hyphomicrobium sp.]